jgi:hypothetical protein
VHMWSIDWNDERLRSNRKSYQWVETLKSKEVSENLPGNEVDKERIGNGV